MGYLQTHLQPGEEVKYIAKIHYFLFVKPVLLLIIGAMLASASVEVSPLVYYIGLIFLIWGILSLLRRLIVKIGSVYAVTNKRVILKSGIIGRRVTELVLSKCEGLQVKQSILGRFFNFGTILVTTGGVTSSYPFLTDPLRFSNEINIQIG